MFCIMFCVCVVLCCLSYIFFWFVWGDGFFLGCSNLTGTEMGAFGGSVIHVTVQRSFAGVSDFGTGARVHARIRWISGHYILCVDVCVVCFWWWPFYDDDDELDDDEDDDDVRWLLFKLLLFEWSQIVSSFLYAPSYVMLYAGCSECC